MDSFADLPVDDLTPITADDAARFAGASGRATMPEAATFDAGIVDREFIDSLASVPARPWVKRGELLRQAITAVLAPGGVGKSVYGLTLAVELATGRPLLGSEIDESVKVLVINNEDPLDELRRRLAGIIQTYNVAPDDLSGRLFMFSGYDSPLTVAKKIRTPDAGEVVIASPLVNPVIDFIRDNDIGAVLIDPFISTHSANENDNGQVDDVVKQYRRIGSETNAAIALFHHTRKMSGDSEAHAGSDQAGRGASSLKDGARIVRTMAKMSAKTGDGLNIDAHEVGRYIRVDDGKSNYSLADAKANWLKMESVYLPCGDSVGVPRPVNLDAAFERAEASDGRTSPWGKPTFVAEQLDKVMTKDSQPASELRPLLMASADIGRTRASDAIRVLPEGENNALKITNGDGFLTKFWVTRTGENITSARIIHRQEVQ